MSDYEDGKVYRYDGESQTFQPLPEDDCYGRALPGEPTFTLLARDPDFYRLIMKWARRRGADIACGERPYSDSGLVANAYAIGANGARWRKENLGKWRQP